MSKNSSVVYLEIQEMLEDYLLGIPVSPLSWLEISYQEKFNKSLDESLGEKTIEELLVEMRNEGMVLFYEKPESKKRYVLSARMVKNRREMLKCDVQELLDKHGGEIPLSSFERIYIKKFKVKWNCHLCCLKDFDDLCSVLNLVVGAGNLGKEVIKARKIYNLRNRKK
ncbi:hypothetical protein Tco_0356597 [Tanacetum coccineum]